MEISNLDAEGEEVEGRATAGNEQRGGDRRCGRSLRVEDQAKLQCGTRFQHAASRIACVSKPKLSRLELQYMQKARERQSNVIRQQIVMGKTFTGPSFLAKPSTVCFRDFVVGTPQRMQITLTNVSFTFNTFRVLDMADEVKDFFDIKYTRPGRMSAGKSCPVTITFTPKLSDDIETSIPFLAQTGAFRVPVRCLRKKAKPHVSHRDLEILGVVMGESGTATLVIENKGSLATHWTIEDKVTPSKDDVPTTLSFRRSGEVSAKGVCRVIFTYKPSLDVQQESVATRKFLLRFDETSADDMLISVSMSTRKVPVYTRTSEVDFRCCVYEKLYRAPLILYNRGKTALKIVVRPPKDVADILSFTPDLGYIQGRDAKTKIDGEFKIQMKLRMQETDRNALAKYFAGPNDDALEIPVRVDVASQALPVRFVVRAQMTTSELTFDPPQIQFNPCLTTQEIAAPLSITNMSTLPQRIGFVGLPEQIRVEPGDGFAVVMPRRTIRRRIIFRPDAAVRRTFTLAMKTSLNRTFKLPCEGIGVDPSLDLSHTRVRFRPAAVGDQLTRSIFVRNVSRSISRTVQFVAPSPEISGIRIRPIVAIVGPGETSRVDIDFSPPSSSNAGVFPAGSVECSEEGEPWSRHGNWKIACVLKDSDTPTQFFDVRTTTVKRCLDVDSSELDFGMLSVGNRFVRRLRITNKMPSDGGEVFDLSASALNPSGAFTILNVLRPVRPGESFDVLVEFAPPQQQKYSETLTVTCARGQVSIRLVGIGVSPTVTLDPATKEFSLGHVLAGGTAKRTFRIRNPSNFSLDYTISRTDKQAYAHYDGISVFDCSPPSGVLASESEREITVRFNPDSERREPYETKLDIQIPGQSENYALRFRGFCWERQMYIVQDRAAALRNEIDATFALPASMDVSKEEDAASLALVRRKRNQREIVLQWPRSDASTSSADDIVASMGVTIGCCAPVPGKKGGSGSFELQLPANFGGGAGDPLLAAAANRDQIGTRICSTLIESEAIVARVARRESNSRSMRPNPTPRPVIMKKPGLM